MRIGHSIFLVGIIPITIAAAIALAALFLLSEAERARNGAVLAGTVYRNLISAMGARDDYLDALPNERTAAAEHFANFAQEAESDLGALAEVVRDPSHAAAVAAARNALARYIERMGELMEMTARNDGLVADMSSRADLLIRLTDQARERQHESNADIVNSLKDGDLRLRATREIVARAQELRVVLASAELDRRLAEAVPAEREAARQRLALELSRLRNAAADLGDLLKVREPEKAAELARLVESYRQEAERAGTGAVRDDRPARALSDWTDRLLKVNTTQQRALHDELAELLTYSVQAHETEQATQNIAIATLKLGQRTTHALVSRDLPTVSAIMTESRTLSDLIASLPISPLIQTDMLDALDQWRDGLATTSEGLRRQAEMLADMNSAARTMISGASLLNDLLTSNADTIGSAIRNILVFGAAIGLLLGSATAFVVARSITRPLSRLQQGMMELAAGSDSGPIAEADRRDELGDMARATNVFVTEIRRREQALRRAKDRADTALAELQKTQTELIQAEKLASLGQLVAGVSHEINTPLGIALTTATLIGDEVRQFRDAAASGQLQRSVFQHFVERMTEGSRLLYANLTRAADLVHSFKQVAVDQASGERRRFEMREWLHELLTSLGPMLRKKGHEVTVECPPDLVLDTYPGALAQVLTNLLMNAVAHAFAEGQSGRIDIRVSEERGGMLRLVFSDDGRGIPPENLSKVFDPFFTTGRSTGSTGLGLHIVYNLVTNRLHGRIELESEVGRGTRFTIDLPASLPEAEPEARREELAGASA